MANRYGSTEANGLLEEESAFSVRKQPSYARKTKTVYCSRRCSYLLSAVLFILLIATVILLAVFGDFHERPDSKEEVEASPISADAAKNSVVELDVSDLEDMVNDSSIAINICPDSGTKPTFPDIDYSFYGYNVLKGYPMAEGSDPGFTRPVFAFDYESGSSTADCRYSIPKGLFAAPDVACDTSFVSTSITNSREHDTELSRHAEAHGGFFGIKFSASYDYKKTTSAVSNDQTKIVQTTAECKYYFTKLNRVDMPEYSIDVIQYLRKMEKSVKETGMVDTQLAYDFIDYFGTHVPNTMNYGARYTYQFSTNSSTYKYLSSQSQSVGAQASYSGLFSLGGGFKLSSSQKESVYHFQNHTESHTVSAGARPPSNMDTNTWAQEVQKAPVPVQYNLIPIYEIFDTKIARSASSQLFEESTLHKIRDGIASMFARYCSLAVQSGINAQCNDESIIKFDDFAKVLDTHRSKVFNLTQSNCMEECHMRKSCNMFSVRPQSQAKTIWEIFHMDPQVHFCDIDMEDKSESYTLELAKGATTMILTQGIKTPIRLVSYRYDSSVLRFDPILVPQMESIMQLRSVCSIHCSQDEQCVGFEVSMDSAYYYNCAKYRQHSKTLIATNPSAFETNIVSGLAKRIIQDNQNSKMLTIPTVALQLQNATTLDALHCQDSACCQSQCLQHTSCISFAWTRQANGSHTCYMSDVHKMNSILILEPAPINQTMSIGIFTERPVAGWFNVSGIFLAGSSAQNKTANSADECALVCAEDIMCTYSSWNGFYSRCTVGSDINVVWGDVSINPESTLMLPNYRARLRLFKV